MKLYPMVIELNISDGLKCNCCGTINHGSLYKIDILDRIDLKNSDLLRIFGTINVNKKFKSIINRVDSYFCCMTCKKLLDVFLDGVEVDTNSDPDYSKRLEQIQSIYPDVDCDGYINFKTKKSIKKFFANKKDENNND